MSLYSSVATGVLVSGATALDRCDGRRPDSPIIASSAD